jgi:hypothetical protein
VTPFIGRMRVFQSTTAIYLAMHHTQVADIQTMSNVLNRQHMQLRRLMREMLDIRVNRSN